MERRAFLQMLCVGLGAVSTATPTKALTMATAIHPAPEAPATGQAVAKPEDIDRARVEKAYYGHWRRVHRRQTRRVTRRVYRRHYYY